MIGVAASHYDSVRRQDSDSIHFGCAMSSLDSVPCCVETKQPRDRFQRRGDRERAAAVVRECIAEVVLTPIPESRFRSVKYLTRGIWIFFA